MKHKANKPGPRPRAPSGPGPTAAPAAPLPAGGGTATPRSGKEPAATVPALAWVLGVSFLSLAIFIGKPFFIDDTLFLRTAEQIQKHPTDFYGFQINWFHTPQPISEVTENPPLASYYLALAASFVGWSEPALHLTFVLPTLAAVWGIFSLARCYCSRPALAAIVAVFTPVFFVSATTLMCDVMLLAFWVWAAVLFEKGLERENPATFVAAGLLAGMAYLTKFSGLALVPLLGVYGLIRQRRLGWWLVAPLLPLLFTAAYEWLTYRLYGHGHFLQASAFSLHEGARLDFAGKLVVGLAFAGGCFLPAVFYSPLMWKPRMLLASAVLTAILVVVLPHTSGLAQLLQGKEGVNWGASLQAALLVASGIHLVAIMTAEAVSRQQAVSVLLVLWVGGVLTFAIFINWVINARSFLPAVPAVAILVGRQVEWRRRACEGGRMWLNLLPAVASVVLCLLLARADWHAAQAARAAATDVCTKYQKPGRTIWFEGHWGFQYYMEKLGAQALDMVNPRVGPDDIVVIPNSAYGVSRPDAAVAAPVEFLRYHPNKLCATVNPPAGACFYAASWGPLPFVFGHLKPEDYIVFQPVRR